VNIVARLLLEGADDLSVALREAVSCGHEPVVRQLLEAGASANAVNGANESVVHMSCAASKPPAILEMLLAEGGHINQRTKDSRQSTLLMEAIILGLDAHVDVVLSARADVNVVNARGRTALMYAAGSNRDQVVQWLLAAKADLQVKNHLGETALTIAVRGGWTAIEHQLRQAGAKE
jgi:ankyrin repeat protein